MTDRLKGFVVSLDHDIREDDAESVRQAILTLRNVNSVEPVAANIDDHLNRDRIRMELETKLLAVLREK